MSGNDLALYVASGLAVSLGVALSLRKREHLPVAVLLVVGLVADLVQRVVRPLYAGYPRPFEGPARGWAHLGQAAFACYPWAVLGAALLVLRRRGWAAAVGCGWLAYEALLVLGYRPLSLREDRLGAVYLVAQTLLVIAMVAVGVAMWRVERKRLTGTVVVMALAMSVEAVILFGPMLSEQPWHHWHREARPPYLFFYLIATIVQGAELWISRRSPRA